MIQPTIKVRNLELSDFLRDYVEKKTRKFDRHLPGITECRVELSVANAKNAKQRQTAQITIRSKNGTTLRAEERSADMLASIDAAVDKMNRQIERFKGKRYRGRGRAPAPRPEIPPEETPEEEEEGPNIVRVKRFEVAAMSAEEAIEQMELLGHDFFVFYDPDAENIGVVYRRQDGNYGLLQPELA